MTGTGSVGTVWDSQEVGKAWCACGAQRPVWLEQSDGGGGEGEKMLLDVAK